MGKKLSFTVNKQEKAVTFLSNSVAGISRAQADLLVKSGEMRVNGMRVKQNAVLEAGDVVSVFVPDAVTGQARASCINTVYDDKNIVVFDKPKRTAYDALPALYGSPLFAVHRLDTNTTGLIVFAKTESVMNELAAAFRERRVKKTYRAAVYPAPNEDRATLTAYTKLLHDQNIALVSAKSKHGYKTMVTEYAVVERIGGGAVLDVFPHTGRTHQIRAHLAFIGCPIIGEHKYGIRGNRVPCGAPESQMLAAVELVFSGLGGGMEYLNGKTFTAPDGFDLDFLRNNASDAQ